MEIFQYEATTRDGNIVTGTLEVVDERSAIDRIQDMGYFPLKVYKAVVSESVYDRFFDSFQGRVSDKDIMTFTYQLGVLLDAGFALDKSLSILSDLSEKKKQKELLQEILSLVRSGKSLSDALSRFPSEFPLFYVNMIKAGEAGGYLEDTISKMATYLENARSLKEDVRSAMIYPLILSIAGGGAVIVLLTFVVPKFTAIFSDMGQALPLPTVILLSISSALVNYWWIIVLSLIIAVIAAKKYLKSERGLIMWDRVKYQIPLFGKLFKESAVSRFARTFGTLLGNGVPLLNALQIVKGTLGSGRISAVISAVREAARKGRGIAEPLKNSKIFPPIAVHMVTVGEETGRLDEMLLKVADRFDAEVRITVKRLLALLEPVLILLMGVVIGFIVISMLMAIFSINELPF